MSELRSFFEKRKIENLKNMGYEDNLNKLKKTAEDYEEEEKKQNKLFGFFTKKKKNY